MKRKDFALMGVTILLCSMILGALPGIAAEQNQEMQKMSTSEVTTSSEDDYVLGVYGNANEDDTIDMRDLTYVKLIFFGKKPETELADAKYDGKINPLDFIQIKLIIVGKEKELTFIDSVERIVTIHKPIERIIALDYYGCEMARTVGAKDKVIASIKFLKPDYWPEMSKKPGVGTMFAPDYEKILDLEPDVVITADIGDPCTEEKLEPAGIPVVRLNFYKPKTLVSDIKILGMMLDEEEGANEFIDFFQGYRNLIRERVGNLNAEEKKRVYFEKDNQKSAGTVSGFHEMIVLAGGINIFDDFSAEDFIVDPEAILDRNPQLVLRSVSRFRTGSGYIPPDPSEMEATWNGLITRPGWTDLDAVKNNQVYIIAFWHLKGAGKLIGTCYLAKWLYPDLFQDLDPEAVSKEWSEKFQGVEYKVGYVYHPSLED